MKEKLYHEDCIHATNNNKKEEEEEKKRKKQSFTTKSVEIYKE